MPTEQKRIQPIPEAENLDEKVKKQVKSLLPKAGDKSVGHVAFGFLEAVIEDKERKRLPHKWHRNYEMYRNHHWRSGANAPIPLASISLVNAHVDRTCNLLTDNNPTFDVIGENEQVANDIHMMSRYWWSETEQQDLYGRSVQMAEIHGCTVEKVIFNPALNSGMGEVETIIVDPHNFGFWPLNEKNSEKWELALHYYTMPIHQARRRWPESAKFIKPDSEWKDALGEKRREIVGGSARPVPKSATGGDYARSHAHLEGNPALLSIMGRGQEVLILEIWAKDYSTMPVVQQEAVVELDLDSGKIRELSPEVKTQEAQYPGYIRVAQCCNGGDVILSDRPNPSVNITLPLEEIAKTYLFDRFPFSLTPSSKDPVNPWGFSSIEQLEQINIEIDKCMSQLNYMKDRMARSPLINPKDSMIDNADFSNAARIVNPKNSVVAKAIRYMESPPVQNDIQIILTTYRELFDKVAGTFDMTDPSVMKGRLAYKTVAAILENMHTLIRGKIRNYGKMLRERGRMYISHMMNWYTEERYYYLEENGVPVTGSLIGSANVIPIHFQVVSGSTMPTSRLQRREEAIQLFELQAIGVRELLEALEWPDRANVATKMEMGVVGPLMDRMQSLGVDPRVIEIVQEVSEMDESTYNALVQQVKEMQGEMAQQGQLTQGGGQLAAV